MFCIRSNEITFGSIEMYGLVTVWTSMDDGPYWVILLMYGSHYMRHTGFLRLTVVNGTPGFWGVTSIFKRLGLGEARLTTVTLQLADRSLKHLRGGGGGGGGVLGWGDRRRSSQSGQVHIFGKFRRSGYGRR